MSDRDTPNNDDNSTPEEEMRRMLEQMLGGGGIDSSKLAGAAGLPVDPQALTHMLMQLQQAMQHPSDGVNWDLVRDAARRAAEPNVEVSADDARAYDRAFGVAALWLGDATGDTIGSFSGLPQTITRYEWLELTLDGWAELTNPVATSISNALVEVLNEQAPEEMREMIERSGPVVRSMGQSMFAMQLGQVLGQLAKEVLSGGDIGMPVLPDNTAALTPQNLDDWSADLELDRDEVLIYFAVRELAHAHLFAHARWLRLHLVSSIAEFARGIRIDTDRIEETIRDLDVSNPEEIQLVLKSGQLIPPRTPEQDQALEGLETVLALIEGWVDVVTEDATSRLPNAGALAEMVRRRRATGSPAEHAFGSLVGLELRPRRLREAMSMWRLVTEKLGAEQRDQLWGHRDALPGASDIDDPFALVERLQGGAGEPDELDNDLARLLGDPSSFGDAPAGGDTSDKGPDTPPNA
jgi:putative hydrolase